MQEMVGNNRKQQETVGDGRKIMHSGWVLGGQAETWKSKQNNRQQQEAAGNSRKQPGAVVAYQQQQQAAAVDHFADNLHDEFAEMHSSDAAKVRPAFQKMRFPSHQLADQV